MKKTFLLGVMMAGAAWADPSVEVSSVTWNADKKSVTVAYALTGEPAVVTFGVTTNGVAASDAVTTRHTGDVNRLVGTGSHTFVWYPEAVWPSVSAADVAVVLTAWATNAPPPFMAVDLIVASNVCYYASADALPGGIRAPIYKSRKLLLRRIPSGGVTYWMGRTSADAPYENYYCKNSETRHKVRFTDDFYLAVYETTLFQHFAVLNGLPCRAIPVGAANADLHPVESLTAYGTSNGYTLQLRGYDYKWPADGHKVTDTSIIGRFRLRTGVEFDLPTDSQWEYACRAGTDTVYYDGLACPTNIAWSKYFDVTAYKHTFTPTGTQEVGLLQPNAWDLYDMCGNVSEPCLDTYEEKPSYGEVTTDPAGTATWDAKIVIRGGNWHDRADWYCRSACRANTSNGQQYSTTPYLGYRLGCPAVAK